MSENFKFFRIKNWERYQPNNSLKSKNAMLQWVRDYTDREDDAEYRSLTMYQRGVLDALCRLAGRTRSRLLQNDSVHIASALQVLPKERHCLPQALSVLTALGFLIPCNEQVENQLVQKTGRDRDREGEESESDSLVSQSVSQQKEPPANAGAELEAEGEAEASVEWVDASVPAYDLPCWSPLHEEFGVVGDLPEAAVRDVHTVLKQMGVDETWMRGCIQFCFQSGFWKHRVVSAKTFAKALKNSLGDDTDGKLAAQYNRYAAARRRAAASGKR